MSLKRFVMIFARQQCRPRPMFNVLPYIRSHRWFASDETVAIKPFPGQESVQNVNNVQPVKDVKEAQKDKDMKNLNHTVEAKPTISIVEVKEVQDVQLVKDPINVAVTQDIKNTQVDNVPKDLKVEPVVSDSVDGSVENLEQLDEPTEEQLQDLAQRVQMLRNELQLMEAQNHELLDKYKRVLADSENMRVFMTKEINEIKAAGILNFCRDLIGTVRILSRATDAVPKEELNERNPHLKCLHLGLQMTRDSMLQVLKRYGLEQIQANFDDDKKGSQ